MLYHKSIIISQFFLNLFLGVFNFRINAIQNALGGITDLLNSSNGEFFILAIIFSQILFSLLFLINICPSINI